MQIKDVMTRDVKLVSPDTPVAVAARLMRQQDVGSLPVGADDRMVGMLTDRDIVLRAVADGKDCKSATAGEVMSKEILYCFDDQDIEEVARNMGEQQIRRLPVVDRDKRLVGIVSLGDLSARGDKECAGDALESISCAPSSEA